MGLACLCFVLPRVFVGCIDFLAMDNLLPGGDDVVIGVISGLSGNLIVLMWLVLLWFWSGCWGGWCDC